MLNNHNIILPILLNDLKLVQLNKISSLLGAIKTGNTKIDKCNNITGYFQTLNKLIEKKNDRDGINIMSIDTGIINFAWSYFNLQRNENGIITLSNWNKLNLNEMFQIHETTFTPIEMSRLTTQLTKFILMQSSPNTIYTIERQRLRTNSSKFITEPILNVNIFEHLLFHSLTNQNREMISSDPGRMTKFWLANKKHYSTKDSKKLRIETVNNLLKDGTVFRMMPPLQKQLLPWDGIRKNGRKSITIYDKLQMNERENGKRKDDDLADSLLHGLSWSMWVRNYQQLCNEVMRSGENLKLDEWIEYHWNEHIKLLDSIQNKT
ncbi:cruciform cutting endonuclease 1, mitochondrial [Monosporozyma unispora]